MMRPAVERADPQLAGARAASARRDSRASRDRLLAVTGRMLADGTRPENLQQIAAAAGLSVATAYRHFGSLDDALQAYAHQTVLMMNDYAASQPGQGVELLRAISTRWVQLAHERGPAMVQLRSRRGFLARRREGDRLIIDTCGYLEPAIRSVLDELDLPSLHLEYGLFLWNLLFDPREVLDLGTTLGWNIDHIVDRLLTSYLAALRANATTGPHVPPIAGSEIGKRDGSRRSARGTPRR